MTDRGELIRLAIVDDHPVLLDGLCATFSAHGDFDIVGQGADYDDALRVAEEQTPDIMLVDIGMPGGGMRAAKDIAAGFPAIKVVILTASEEADDVITALRSGVQGYVLKSNSGAELIGIVKKLSDGQPYVPPKLAGKMLVDLNERATRDDRPAADPLDSLTYREDQILKLVAVGLSNREIGGKLDIREKTVKHYMTNIMQKLQVRNRVEAALMAKGRATLSEPPFAEVVASQSPADGMAENGGSGAGASAERGRQAASSSAPSRARIAETLARRSFTANGFGRKSTSMSAMPRSESRSSV